VRLVVIFALPIVALALVACSHGESAVPFGSGASDCATCHAEHAEQFASAAHSRSSRSPVFEALLPRVEAMWGTAARARCVGCHSPQHGTDETVTCVSCHAAVGHRGASDARLVVDLDAPIVGPWDDADSPHATRTSGLLQSSELCSTCHEVSGPGLFVEHTGTEHLDAVRATAAPECAACHLSRLDDGPVAPGGIDRERHDHRFVGLDPRWGGTDAERAQSREDSRALLDDALELRVSREGEAVVVELENVGASHAVPTGVAFLRDVWVDVELEHADGSIEVRERVIELGDLPMRGEVRVALPTDADHIEERRLYPFEVRRVQLDVAATRATARLRFRALREDALVALELPLDDVPAIEVVAVER
jgi:hypothetical protein